MGTQAQILVVDDQKTLRDVLSKALTKAGHRCVTATDGEEALALARQQAFDLVLTDLKMPKMGGLALIEWLRKERPELPIIIMTAYGDLESARKALRLNVSDYLLKPFEGLSQVQAAVQRALETRVARSDAQTLLKEFETRAKEFDRRERHLTQTLDRAKAEIEALAGRLERSEAAASGQADQIEAMIENLDNGILVTNTQGAVLGLNHELRRQLQMASHGGAGSAVDRLPGDPALREAMIESRDRIRSGVEEPGVEEPVVVETTDNAGTACTYEVRSIPVGGSGALIVTTVRSVRR